MPSPAILQLETSPSWVVGFPFAGDRFGCDIGWRDQTGKLTRLLTSVEGEAGHPLQPSPPFQQLHIQSINGRPVAFGVGMANGLHYSCSVSLAGAEGRELLFEYAVNRIEADRPPTNTWWLAPGTQLQPPGSDPLAWQALHTEDGPSFSLELAGCRWQSPPDQTVVGSAKQLFVAVDLAKARTAPVTWSIRMSSPAT